MRVLALLIGAFALFAAPGASQVREAPRPALYDVVMEIFDGDRLVATPKIRMREGGSTIMTVDRPGGYSMRVRLSRWGAPPEGEAAGERLRVATELHLRRETTWALAATPELMVAPGRKASMEIAPSNADPGRTAKLRLTILVTPTADTTAAKAGGSKPCTAVKEAQWRQAMASPAPAAMHLVQIAPKTPCCSSGCVTCCGDTGTCCCESTQCNACCCT